jgi:hypothetical protein
MERIVPYPHPDFSDPDLLTKELTNGSFIPAIFQELSSFRPPMERYNVTAENLTDIMALKGDFGPQIADPELYDRGMSHVKQVASLPYTVPDDKPEPETIYDPREHYNFVEYIGYSSTELSVPLVENLYCSTPYYDRANAGLFGFRFVKDADGNITDRYAMFVPLKTFKPVELARWPDGANFDSRSYVGYVKGAAVYACYVSATEQEFVSITLDGRVFRRTVSGGKQYRPLGDHGCFVTTDAGRTVVYDIELKEVYSVDGDFCGSDVTLASGHTPYPFGSLIGDTFYYPHTDETGWKYRKAGSGWSIAGTNKAIWKYNKAVFHDYLSDNWMNEPLKAVRYNLIRHGIFVPVVLPYNKASGEKIDFRSSDPYGDFAMVTDASEDRALKHTYDFRSWEAVTDSRAVTRFYGMWGRVWIDDRPDDIVGYMPYTMAVMDINDKMVLIFDGFVFRMR